MGVFLKCRKCRKHLIDDSCHALTVHGAKLDFNFIYKEYHECSHNPDVLYFHEGGLPAWMLDKINEAGWQKGKLNCPNCSARVGAFDFVSGQKCTCAEYVVPPVYLVKSKIDCLIDSVQSLSNGVTVDCSS